MVQSSWSIRLLILVASVTIFTQAASAQTQVRKGVLLQTQVKALAERSTTVSQGQLAQLKSDPYFAGDYQTVFNLAASILDGYKVVKRGGVYPENQGIPRNQQLTKADVVYYLLSLSNGNSLYLFRSPNENTSQYLIQQQ